jgi:hypothetical protein
MALEAPLSKFRRNNFIIYIAICLAVALWFAYDGYLNQGFIEDHSPQGRPDSTLVINQKAPFALVGCTILLAGYWYAIRHRKLVAAEDALILANGRRIPYDSIEQIDKTYFEKKGFFTITYKNEAGKLVRHRLSDRHYDNLSPLLDHLVAQIT